jgi:hypothetical protein
MNLIGKRGCKYIIILEYNEIKDNFIRYSLFGESGFQVANGAE